MSPSDPRDLATRLHADAEAPHVGPTFFETLALSATQSTPSPTPPPLARRVGRAKIAAVMTGTAVLIGGAAYAGGLMGGGGSGDASDLAPTRAVTESPETVDSDGSAVDHKAAWNAHGAISPRGEIGDDAGKHAKSDTAPGVGTDESANGSQGCQGQRPDQPPADRLNDGWWPGCHDEWPGHQDTWPGQPADDADDPSNDGDEPGAEGGADGNHPDAGAGSQQGGDGQASLGDGGGEPATG